MPVSPKKRITNDRYNSKCDYMCLRPLKDKGQKIREAAAAAGQSLQGYIFQAVDERMERDAHKPPCTPSTAPDDTLPAQ